MPPQCSPPAAGVGADLAATRWRDAQENEIDAVPSRL